MSRKKAIIACGVVVAAYLAAFPFLFRVSNGTRTLMGGSIPDPYAGKRLIGPVWRPLATVYVPVLWTLRPFGIACTTDPAYSCAGQPLLIQGWFRR